jgi:hypothetical protein
MLLLFSQNFLGEGSDSIGVLLTTSFDISVLDIVDKEATVLTSSEKLVVVKTELHSFDRLGVTLDLVLLVDVDLSLAFTLLGVVDFVNLDTTWSVWLTNTSEEGITVLSDGKLRDSDSGIDGIFGVNRVPDFLVTSDNVNLVHVVWNVHGTGHNDLLLVEILILDSSTNLFQGLEIIEVDITVHSARGESHVILKPVNASDSVNVTFTLVVAWVLVGVKVENVNGVLVDSACEQVTSMRESYLSASLDLNILEWEQSLGQHVHKQDLVSDGHHNVETRWMEGYSQGFLSGSETDFKGLLGVVPNLDSLVLGAGNDQLLSDTDVETSDLVLMEGSVHEVGHHLVVKGSIQSDVNLHELVVRGDEVEDVFIDSKAHGSHNNIFVEHLQVILGCL